MTGTRNYRIGSKVSLPDGPYGELVRIEDGVEYGRPVHYLTVRHDVCGNVRETTRWVAR